MNSLLLNKVFCKIEETMNFSLQQLLEDCLNIIYSDPSASKKKNPPDPSQFPSKSLALLFQASKL